MSGSKLNAPKVNVALDLVCAPRDNPQIREAYALVATAVTPVGNFISSFSRFAKPVRRARPSRADLKAHGVSFRDVAEASDIAQTYEYFLQWVARCRDRYVKPEVPTLETIADRPGIFPEDVSLLTWGKTTVDQLSLECRKVPTPFPFQVVIDLQHHLSYMDDTPKAFMSLWPQDIREYNGDSSLTKRTESIVEQFRLMCSAREFRLFV